MNIVSHKTVEVGTGEVEADFPDRYFDQILAFLGYGFCKSHAISYAMYSAVGLWFKANYPLEFMCANLSVTDRAQEKKGVPLLNQRVAWCLSRGIRVFPPDVETSGRGWTIRDGGLVAPLSNIKSFGEADEGVVLANRPYRDAGDFFDKTKIGKSKAESLIFSGALDRFGERGTLYNWYHNVYLNKGKAGGASSLQLSLFQDDCPAAEERCFTQAEIEDLFYELNGFSLTENLVAKYAGLLDERAGKGRVKTIGQAKRGACGRRALLLCRIRRKSEFTSRNGNQIVKIEIADGCDTAEIVMSKGNHERYARKLAEQRDMVLPVQFSDDGKSIYIDNLDKTPVRWL